MRAIKAFFKIISAIITLALALLLAGNIYVIAARALTGDQMPELFGFSSAVVVTGSMSPAIEAGDFIVCRESAGYQPGDVITFREGGSMVTHRIVGTADGGFITKGDANNTEDMGVAAPEDIRGKVVLRVPKLGIFIEKLRTPLGMTLIVFAGLALIELPRLAGTSDNRGEQEEKYHGRHTRRH